ncbi:hypothetical protein K2173_002291 [Erythroxylum novogranatense]|uniref:GATA transcription factor n=1 Tax=Erythroxylum novogranatense TaxID=1862640 RepID=A0AAV8T9Q1_9ROSI|nr:hypothetical protein K2173_002291 [Erythroxylum novogranatense]
MKSCTEAIALKSSFRGELSRELCPQAIFDDLSCWNATSGGVFPAEDFSVDCFFNFSEGECKDDFFQEHETEEQVEEEKDSISDSVSSQERSEDDNSNSCSFSDSLFNDELPVPVDDLADLEWVSQFVDDSLSEIPVLYPVGEDKAQSFAKTRFQQDLKPGLTRTPCLFPYLVPAKARTKRSGRTGRSWSGGSSLTESSSSSSTSSSASTPYVTVANADIKVDSSNDVVEPPLKKQKNGPAVQPGQFSGSTQFQRRCSHCQVQKTPQWRTGPLGAKTLCNACGVRYKSGRLFPEYRPACSPTFSGDIHSNSHRKVLEIRKKREMTGPGSDLNQMVSSF